MAKTRRPNKHRKTRAAKKSRKIRGPEKPRKVRVKTILDEPRRMARKDEQALARLVEKYGAQPISSATTQVKARRPGRPKKLLKTIDRESLALSMEETIDVYLRKGVPDPVRSAIAEWALIEGLPESTIDRYRREGLRRMADVDAAHAEWLDALTAKGQSRDVAVKIVAREARMTLAMMERSIDRHCRRKARN